MREYIHKSITLDRVEPAVRESMFGLASIGFCTACGDEVEHVEPDARNYDCDSCGRPGVFGAEELLFHLDSGGLL